MCGKYLTMRKTHTNEPSMLMPNGLSFWPKPTHSSVLRGHWP